MEFDRKALGLQGVLFRYYVCAECGTEDIFVDLHRLAGESDQAFRERRMEMESVIRRLDAERAEVVIVERHPGFSVWV